MVCLFFLFALFLHFRADFCRFLIVFAKVSVYVNSSIQFFLQFIFCWGVVSSIGYYALLRRINLISINPCLVSDALPGSG